MIHVSFKDEGIAIDLNLKRRVTLVTGDSGTGKTFLVNRIREIQARYPQTTQAFIADSLQLFNLIPSASESVIIIDKADQYLAGTQLVNCVADIRDKYFIIFARSGIEVPGTLHDAAKLEWEKTDNTMQAGLKYYWG